MGGRNSEPLSYVLCPWLHSGFPCLLLFLKSPSERMCHEPWLSHSRVMTIVLTADLSMLFPPEPPRHPHCLQNLSRLKQSPALCSLRGSNRHPAVCPISFSVSQSFSSLFFQVLYLVNSDSVLPEPAQKFLLGEAFILRMLGRRYVSVSLSPQGVRSV